MTRTINVWKLAMTQLLLTRLIQSSWGFQRGAAPFLSGRSSAVVVAPRSPTGSFGGGAESQLLLSSLLLRRSFSSVVPLWASSRSPPPEFTVVEDDDDNDNDEHVADNDRSRTTKHSQRKPPRQSYDNGRNFRKSSGSAPDFDIRFDETGDVSVVPPQARTPSSKEAGRSSVARAASPNASWMDRNQAFLGGSSKTKSFREDFRGTRVFVQNLPPEATWQDLKDHFRVVGNVVFASVSTDMETGLSKGHGIVQFETTEMAEQAIATMGDLPLDGHVLYVRKDVQGERPGALLKNEWQNAKTRGPTPPTKWKCADEDAASHLAPETITAIRMLMKQRDNARRRMDYETSDEIREVLLKRHGVRIDDRLKMWWIDIDGGVPETIKEIKGGGRWDPKAWSMTASTPENDACVNPDLVNALLKQRDIARREKDFVTADSLLKQAIESPDGDLILRIDDASRTWRVWTLEKPTFSPRRPKRSPVEECIAITKQHAPHRVEEIKKLLEKFPGREYNILDKLRKQFDA